jgi:hypothetical protein
VQVCNDEAAHDENQPECSRNRRRQWRLEERN